MHEVLVNRLGGLSLPRNSVVRIIDRPHMTLDVYRGRKTTTQQQQIFREKHENAIIVLHTGFRRSALFCHVFFMFPAKNERVCLCWVWGYIGLNADPVGVGVSVGVSIGVA